MGMTIEIAGGKKREGAVLAKGKGIRTEKGDGSEKKTDEKGKWKRNED